MRVKFADTLKIINGKNQQKVEDPQGKYPIYGSGGIMGYANDYICPAETVIIGRKGSINKPIFADTPFWNVDTAFGLCTDKAKLFPKYLYNFCVNFDFECLNTTVTIPSLTKSNLLNIEIPLPPLDEQRRIAAVLDKVSDLIAKRREQMNKLDELVKARFVEMFGGESDGKIVSMVNVCKIDEHVKGIAQKTLNLSEVRKLSFPLPPMKQQEKFAAFVEQTDKSKLTIQQSLDTMETLKKALMQEYFG